jgi:hypothetical protein
MTMSTVGTNFPANSLFVDIRPDGLVLGGVDDDQHLDLFLYDLTGQRVIARTNIISRFDDLEALAWPGACADPTHGSIPRVMDDTPQQGAPGSYFPLRAIGFAPHAEIDVTSNGSLVGSVIADASGQVALTLFYDTNAPIATYTIDFTEQRPTVSGKASWSAETPISIDGAVPQLTDVGDGPILPGTLRLYLPMTRT